MVRALDSDREIELAPTYLDGGWIFALPGGTEVHEPNHAAIAALKRSVERQLKIDIPKGHKRKQVSSGLVKLVAMDAAKIEFA